MAVISICKLNKFLILRYGQFCNFKHEKNCDAKARNLRHPPKCRNIMQGKACPFGSCCSFDHNITGDLSENNPVNDNKKKVKDLEKLIDAKNDEIRDLLETINNLNGVDNLEMNESHPKKQKNTHLLVMNLMKRI